MIVLGIDPGYALMGWGVVEAQGSRMRLLGYGCIETKAGTPMQHRLRTLQLGVRDLTLMYRPDEVAFEELFFAQNVTTALMVGAARGAAIIAAAVFTGLYGKVFDQKGFRFAILPTLGLLAVGYVGLYFFRDTAMVFLSSLVMMCGYLGTGAMLGAQIPCVTPVKKAGMFQGLRIIGQVLIPGVIGPAVGAAILSGAEMVANSDGTESFVPNENIFLGALVALVITFASLIPLFKLLKKQR